MKKCLTYDSKRIFLWRKAGGVFNRANALYFKDLPEDVTACGRNEGVQVYRSEQTGLEYRVMNVKGGW